MKRIIAVRGISNSGKTTSIKRALDIVKEESSARVVVVIKDGRDVIVVVEIDGIIVFASAGDLEKMLKELFDRIKDIDWKILVCATKSRGATVDFINNLGSSHSVEWVENKWVNENINAANEATAREIVKRLSIP